MQLSRLDFNICVRTQVHSYVKIFETWSFLRNVSKISTEDFWVIPISLQGVRTLFSRPSKGQSIAQKIATPFLRLFSLLSILI